jgi:hypothetical protein
MQKDNHYNMVREELLTLVRKLAKSATAPKNDQKRDKEEDKQEHCTMRWDLGGLCATLCTPCAYMRHTGFFVPLRA